MIEDRLLNVEHRVGDGDDGIAGPLELIDTDAAQEFRLEPEAVRPEKIAR